MKKIFLAMVAFILLIVSSTALANVLNDGWKESTEEELQNAVNEINKELMSRKAAKGTEEVQSFSGHGTSIEQVSVTSVPARVMFSCKDKDSSDAVKITGGKKEIKLNPYRSCYDEGLISEAGDYTVMIETPDDWTLSIQPLVDIGPFSSLSGNKSVFSDIFTLDAPQIVTLAIDPVDDSGSFIIKVWYCKDSKWDNDYEQTLFPDLVEGEAYTYDMILKPKDGATAYAISVYSNYENLNWSITAK